MLARAGRRARSPAAVRYRRLMVARRALPLLTSVVVALGALGACGDEAEQSAAEIVAGAAEQTAEAAGLDVQMEAVAEGTGAGDGTVLDMTATQAADGSSMEGEMELGGQRIEIILVDGSYFYAFPGLPDGKEWAEVTLDELAELGFDAAAVQGQDSSQTLALLDAAGEVEEIGEDEIDGDRVSRYRALVDVGKLNEDIVTGELRDQMLGLLGDDLEMEVAIDDDGYVRRMEYVIDLAAAPDPPEGMPTKGEIRYVFEMGAFTDDYEAPERPDPSSVVAMSELGA